MSQKDARARFEERWTQVGAALDPTLPPDATIRTDTLRRLFAQRRERSKLAPDVPPPSSAPPPSVVVDPAFLPPISIVFADAEGAAGDSPPREGERAADLAIMGLLGEGGMGAVYVARQRALERDVAIKLAHRGAPPEAMAALLREARLTGALEHPNIVPVHAIGRDEGGRPVLVMKRIEGVVWRELLRDPEHPAWARSSLAREDRLLAHLEILMQVCNALHFAHRHGVFHRDVKPENVMIGEFGEVYLLDWGIALRKSARRSRDIGIVGTPAYMAPEMVVGSPDDVDARTDVYLLGATLHEVLTGRFRHQGATLNRILLAASLSEPVAYGDDVPPELAALCNAATSADPAARPPSAIAFRQALADFLRHRSSLSIAASAQKMLERMRELVTADVRKMSTTSGDLGRLMVECRFAFLQALREWSGNEAARRGLSACVELGVEREIALRNPAAARALLTELPEPRPDLAARIDALAAEQKAARDREELFAKRARDLDTSISARTRMLVMSVFLLVGMALAVKASWDEIHTGQAMPMREMLTFDLALVAVLGVSFVATGRKLLANTFNRRLSGLALTVTGTSALMDAFAWSRGLPSATASVLDTMMIAACFAVGALTIGTGLWWASAVMVAAAVVAAFVPWLTGASVGIAMTVTVVILFEEARRSARKA